MDNTRDDRTGPTRSDNGQAAMPTPSFGCNVRRFSSAPSQYYRFDESPAVALPRQTDYSGPLGITIEGDKGERDIVVPPITPAALRAMLTGGGIYYDADSPGRVIYRGGWG